MLIAETLQLDLGSIVGVGGTGFGGWVAATLWSAYKKWSAESELRRELMREQIQDLKRGAEHRTKEERFWSETTQHRMLEEELFREMRTGFQGVRPAGTPTGPQRVVTERDMSPLVVEPGE